MAYLLLVLTTLFWSGNFVLARAMHLDMPPISMAFWRWLIAMLILLPWVMPKIWAERTVIRQHGGILVLLSVLGVVNFNTFIYLGLQNTTAVNATLLQSAVPVVILLLSRFVLKLQISRNQYLGICVSLVGVLMIISKGEFSILSSMQINRGDVWVLGAVFSWAFYTIALRWRPQALSGLALLGCNVIVGVILLLPLYLWETQTGRLIEWHQANLAVVAYMAIFPSILAYIFWNRGVQELGAAKAGLFVHLMPVFGLLLSVVFLGEHVRGFHLLGISLIFAGIYLSTFLVRSSPVYKNRNTNL
ncbi:DMT family transporter [Motiliproteus sp. MSK22-1]|uniref:DMT family transporter n=1 Tax=Motiliproteus sp. MSK22-1 TaxID=1897630 RepID=UPI000978AF59|nr:DMT family transporter [Motiliproteus sp. MSK22-1]OMH38198.1 hypothetical protein BGP75_08060 [Motiliproteus sp. MSK22-1]